MASRVAQINNLSKTRVLYRTITPNLDKWPNTGELKTLLNEHAVIQSVKNLIRTYPTERHYHPDVGSEVSKYGLFEFVDQFQSDRLQQEVINTLINYEPRASRPQCVVTAFPQNNYFKVDVTFTLAASGQVVSVPTIVIRTR